ncbi:mitochondrial ribosomal protein L21 [Dermatophagoides pteronyssinus]|uniref:mitochondrial ribosomal protein L21 n=1 Tax=Dermatophagoides pteronyssinus TaxID=6956 RepID=UPI003F67ED23
MIFLRSIFFCFSLKNKTTTNKMFSLLLRKSNQQSLFISKIVNQTITKRTLMEQQHEIVFHKVNSIIESKNFGQTFAVIHLYGKQYLVHLNDIFAVKTAIPADIGERIKLEKCLLVGNENFTLIGRPVLNRDLVQVEATIIEKTMTQTNMDMFHIPRKHGFKRYRFNREPLTMLRINDITVCHPLNTNQKQIN